MGSPRLFTDTTDFTAIQSGDEILVGEERYLVTGMERERRFGVEDPKFWVKRAVHSTTGERKIIKLSYFESFETNLGGVKIRCFRDPKKEADILSLTAGHPHFMQGKSYTDTKGNSIRVLDIVHGPTIMTHIDSLRVPYETYFKDFLPRILHNLIPVLEAIRFLHRHGFRHGDIRNDHLIVHKGNGAYVWIDFDYDYDAPENPFGLDIFGLGNILCHAVGKGFHDLYMIRTDLGTYGDLAERIVPDDFSILHPGRLMNLRKLYPCIPVLLNNMLMLFSQKTSVYYELVDELIDDLKGYLNSL